MNLLINGFINTCTRRNNGKTMETMKHYGKLFEALWKPREIISEGLEILWKNIWHPTKIIWNPWNSKFDFLQLQIFAKSSGIDPRALPGAFRSKAPLDTRTHWTPIGHAYWGIPPKWVTWWAPRRWLPQPSYGSPPCHPLGKHTFVASSCVFCCFLLFLNMFNDQKCVCSLVPSSNNTTIDLSRAQSIN